MEHVSLKIKCLAASFGFVALSLLAANGAIPSDPWLNFVGLDFGGKNPSNAMNIALENDYGVNSNPYIDERVYANSTNCRSSEYSHLIGLTKSALANFYFPGDSLIVSDAALKLLEPSKFNRLFIKFDVNGKVEKVFCY